MNDREMRLEIARLANAGFGVDIVVAQKIYDWVIGKSAASPAVTPASPSQALAPKRRGRPRKITAQVLTYVGASKNDDAKPKKRKYTKKNTAYWGK